MKYPKLEEKESWESKKERVLNDLKKKGEKFIQSNLDKFDKYKSNS